MLWKTEEEHESLSGNYSTHLPLYREATLQAVPVKGKQQQRGSCNRDCQAWQTPKRCPAAHLWVTPWVNKPGWDEIHSEAWWLENLGWGINDLIRNKTIMKTWDNIPVLICTLHFILQLLTTSELRPLMHETVLCLFLFCGKKGELLKFLC